MGGSHPVRVTANFRRNLDEIREFLVEREAPEVFDALLDRLFETVIPNLAQYPEMGVDFLGRRPGSVEGRAQWARLLKKAGAGTVVREYVFDEYLALYALRDGAVVLLSIKHHRQLSFDLRGHWG